VNVLGRYAATLAVLAWAGVALGEPPKLTIPAEVKAQGDYVTLTPTTEAKAVSYVGKSGVDPFPSELLKDARTFVLPVRGLPAGRYKFTAVGSLNDEHTRVAFEVVVGDAPPDVPPDVPPGPVDPDVPPAPDVTALPIYRAALAAYGADVSATKAKDKTALAGVYRSLARTAVPDPAVVTAGDLAKVVQAARLSAVGDRLQAVREIFGNDFEEVAPADPATVLTAAQKKAIQTRFERYAGVLGAIK
jgi:hypothetical protein